MVYDENAAPVIVAPSITLSDPDDTSLASATVSLSGPGFNSAL